MIPMHTIGEILKRAARTLAPHSASPRLDAELLLGAVLGIARSALIVRGSETLAQDLLRDYQGLLDRRVRGAPVAYLTGTREFWSLPLKVTPAVLVPRPETETLVEQALELAPLEQESKVLDLGTGSGAVALAIAAERARARVIGVDISAAALEVARENGRALALSNVEWRRGSWFEPVPGERFDLIVANPPYIADGDPALLSLTAEPALALVGGPTGLEALAAIIVDAAAHLEPGGTLLLEHGFDQHDEVARLLARHRFTGVRSHADCSGKLRVTRGTLHYPPQETS